MSREPIDVPDLLIAAAILLGLVVSLVVLTAAFGLAVRVFRAAAGL